MSDNKIKIGITSGDPNGIGYEVIIKALSDPRMNEMCIPVIYGSSKPLLFYKKGIAEAENFSFNNISSAGSADPKRVNLISCPGADINLTPGEATAEGGKASVAALKAAAADLKKGLIDAVVTAPISKEGVQGPDFPHTGHTEFFATEFGGTPLMMMCSDILKIGLVTIHIPVSAISSAITQEKVISSLRGLHRSMIKDFSIREPRIAVLGLNPHAGDGGVIGSEEAEIIKPAIARARSENILAFGPFAADGFFASAGYTKYDSVLAMYHDQGLTPFKALSYGGVNFTAGLPVVRTSPAHGTGFDIAGQDKADAQSMRDAIYMALDIVRSRRIYNEITADPLKAFKREAGKDVSASELPGADSE